MADQRCDRGRNGGLVRSGDGGFPPPILLDVTRLVSRIGRGPPTGIDRVEAAWLGHLAGDPRHHLLCRTRLGQLVLPSGAAAMILAAVGMDGGGRTASARQSRQTSFARHRFEASLFRAARARAGRSGAGIAAALRRAGLVKGAIYLNTGHANLDPRLLAAMPLPRAVLVHDAIPLDFPQWTRPGQDQAFRTRLQAVFDHAHLVVTVSRASADRLAAWHQELAPLRDVPIMAAHIGTSIAPPDPQVTMPAGAFFLTLGTIEPRKNHALLLDVWARLPEPPGLIIAGRRGWRNEAVFSRLDALPQAGPIREAADLSDAAIAALMGSAHALLFPSLAEGFGMPLTEAAARGVPILASDLPSSREILGDYPNYLSNSPVIWTDRIMAMARAPRLRHAPVAVPGWPEHFRQVGAALAGLHDREAAG